MSTMADNLNISPGDRAAIAELLQQMRTAWADGDGESYAALFTADAHYVNAPGQRVVGAHAIGQSHQQIFDTVLHNTHLGEDYPQELESIADGVVLLHTSGAVLFAGEGEMEVSPNGLMTMLLVKRDCGWRIHSFTNTPTGRLRNVKFLVRYLKSRLHPFTAEWRKARRHMLDEKHRNIAEWQKVNRR